MIPFLNYTVDGFDELPSNVSNNSESDEGLSLLGQHCTTSSSQFIFDQLIRVVDA